MKRHQIFFYPYRKCKIFDKIILFAWITFWEYAGQKNDRAGIALASFQKIEWYYFLLEIVLNKQ